MTGKPEALTYQYFFNNRLTSVNAVTEIYTLNCQ